MEEEVSWRWSDLYMFMIVDQTLRGYILKVTVSTKTESVVEKLSKQNKRV